MKNPVVEGSLWLEDDSGSVTLFRTTRIEWRSPTTRRTSWVTSTQGWHTKILVMNIRIRQHQFLIQFMCYCHFDNLYLLQSHICNRWRFSKILHRSTGFHLEMTAFHCSKTLPMLKTLFPVHWNCCPGSYGEHSAQLLGDGSRVRCSSHRHVDWGVRRLEGRFLNIPLDIKFRRSARLLLVWFSFVTIQASASIPYWPQNDGSSLELGEFTITKRF